MNRAALKTIGPPLRLALAHGLLLIPPSLAAGDGPSWVATGPCACCLDEGQAIVVLEDSFGPGAGEGASLALYARADLALLRRLLVPLDFPVTRLAVDSTAGLAYLPSPEGGQLCVVQLQSGAHGLVPLLEDAQAADRYLTAIELVPDLDQDGIADVLLATCDFDARDSLLLVVGSARRAILSRVSVEGSVESVLLAGEGGACLVARDRELELRELLLPAGKLRVGRVLHTAAGLSGDLARLDASRADGGRTLLWGRGVESASESAQVIVERLDLGRGVVLSSRQVPVRHSFGWSLSCTGEGDELVVVLGEPDGGIAVGRLHFFSGSSLEALGELSGERILDHFGSGVLLFSEGSALGGIAIGNLMNSTGGFLASKFRVDRAKGQVAIVATVRMDR